MSNAFSSLPADPASFPRTARRGRRLVARVQRHDLVGPHGGLGGAEAGIVRPAGEVESPRARRRPLRHGRRLRARQARLRLPGARGARSRRRAAVGGAARRRAHRGRQRRAAGVHLRRRAIHQRRAVAHSVLAHRGVELLPRAERAAAGVPQRVGRQLFLFRRQRRRRAREQEDPHARDQGRRHRPHQRAVREGDRSEEARHCR